MLHISGKSLVEYVNMTLMQYHSSRNYKKKGASGETPVRHLYEQAISGADYITFTEP